jgi:fibronectin type 3 domain-containing protein
VYSEDVMNTWDTGDDHGHKVRVFPYRKASGKLVPTTFVVAMEEAQNGDFQDAVLIVENVKRYDSIAAPTNLAAVAQSPTKVSLSWKDASNNEVSFVIERSGRKSGTYAVVGSVPAGTTVFQDTQVTGGATYFYRVRAVHKSGHYEVSNRAAATTPV